MQTIFFCPRTNHEGSVRFLGRSHAQGSVDGQLAGMHSVNSGEPKLVYYFNKTIPKCFDSNGVKLTGGCKGTINIQQKFFKYGKKVK